jgi:hypothetical protein
MALWLLNFENNAMSRLSLGQSTVSNRFRSPDATRPMYQVHGAKKTTLTLTLGEHAPNLLLDDGHANYPDVWSPGGKWIMCRREGTSVN